MTHEIEVWVLVNHDGSYRVADSRDEVEEHGAEDGYTSARLVKLRLNVETPEPTEIVATLPAPVGGVEWNVDDILAREG